MNIIEMRDKRASLWNNAKEYLSAHTDSNGTISAEDAAQYDRMVADVDNLGKQIERLENQSTMDSMLSVPTSKPLMAADEKKGTASASYVKDMLIAMRSKFRNVSNSLVESTDANGGYLVPDEWDARLIETLNEENVMRKLGTVIRTEGEHKIPVVATKPAAAWIEEGGAISQATVEFAQKVLDAYKLHVAVQVSEELLYDNKYNLANWLVNAFANALGNAEEDAFLNGAADAHKPTGVLVDCEKGVTGVSTLKADDIIELVYKLKRPYRKNAAFIMNDATIALVRKFKDTNGAYMWQPSYQMGEPDRLLGFPVYSSAYAPLTTVAGSCPIAFGDFSYYNIGDRGTRSMQQLNEVYAATGMVGFIAKERVDGKLLIAEAVQGLQMA